MKRKAFLLIIVLTLLQIQVTGQDYGYLEGKGKISSITPESGIEQPVTIKVVYDNYAKIKEMVPDWGYSVYIEGLEKTILFDAGTKPQIFEANFRKMNLDAAKVDFIVLSHEHGDHTGGITAFVKMKNQIPAIIPYSFSDAFKISLKEYGLEPLLAKHPAEICHNLYTTGQFDYQIPEQALVIDTRKGLVVITGCAHPGIIEMLRTIKTSFNKNIYMVFGGFHLLNKSGREMKAIISEMKSLGVVKCGATHCSGEKQIAMIKEVYGENFIELGAGNNIVIQ